MSFTMPRQTDKWKVILSDQPKKPETPNPDSNLKDIAVYLDGKKLNGSSWGSLSFVRENPNLFADQIMGARGSEKGQIPKRINCARIHPEVSARSELYRVDAISGRCEKITSAFLKIRATAEAYASEERQRSLQERITAGEIEDFCLDFLNTASFESEGIHIPTRLTLAETQGVYAILMREIQNGSDGHFVSLSEDLMAIETIKRLLKSRKDLNLAHAANYNRLIGRCNLEAASLISKVMRADDLFGLKLEEKIAKAEEALEQSRTKERGGQSQSAFVHFRRLLCESATHRRSFAEVMTDSLFSLYEAQGFERTNELVVTNVQEFITTYDPLFQYLEDGKDLTIARQTHVFDSGIIPNAQGINEALILDFDGTAPEKLGLQTARILLCPETNFVGPDDISTDYVLRRSFYRTYVQTIIIPLVRGKYSDEDEETITKRYLQYFDLAALAVIPHMIGKRAYTKLHEDKQYKRMTQKGNRLYRGNALLALLGEINRGLEEIGDRNKIEATNIDLDPSLRSYEQVSDRGFGWLRDALITIAYDTTVAHNPEHSQMAKDLFLKYKSAGFLQSKKH